jgi:hypothetical protein
LVRAQPYGGKKKGADGGIDGIIYFYPENKHQTEKVIVSVKGGANVNVGMVRDLGHVMEREGAKIGLFLTLAEPTEPMLKEATRAGYYETEFGRYPKLQILSIEQLFNGATPLIPRVDATMFKQATQEDRNTQTSFNL